MRTKNKYNLQNIFTEYADILTTSDIIKMLNISKKMAHKLLYANEIKCVLSGPVFYIPKKSVIAYLNKIEKQNDSGVIEDEM